MRTRTSSPYKHLGAHLHSNPENGSAKNSSQRTGSRLNFKPFLNNIKIKFRLIERLI